MNKSALLRQNPQQRRIEKKFKRSQEKDYLSARSSSNQSITSLRSFNCFYQPTSKISTRPIQSMVKGEDIKIRKQEKKRIVYPVSRKQISVTEKFGTKEYLASLTREDLLQEIEMLKSENFELERKLTIYKNTASQMAQKENKCTNKMKQKTMKERVNELLMENASLKETIESLKAELKQMSDTKLVEDSTKQSIQNSQLEIQLETNEKEIFTLNEQIQKLRIQLDFINRRNHSEMLITKTNFEKELRVFRDKNHELTKLNSQLQRKNQDLRYIIRNSAKSNTISRVDRQESLLSLSPD